MILKIIFFKKLLNLRYSHIKQCHYPDTKPFKLLIAFKKESKLKHVKCLQFTPLAGYLSNSLVVGSIREIFYSFHYNSS